MILFASLRSAQLAAVAAAVVSVSCSQRSPLEGPPDARLSYSEVKAIAENAARANGFDLAEFDEPVLRFEHEDAKREWLVYFQMKSPPPPGGHFLVVVDDATSKPMIHAGE